MGKKLDIGDTNGKARKVKKLWFGGTDGKARKIKKMWIGDASGKARLFFSGGASILIKAAIVSTNNPAQYSLDGGTTWTDSNGPTSTTHIATNGKVVCASVGQSDSSHIQYTHDGAIWTRVLEDLGYRFNVSRVTHIDEKGEFLCIPYKSVGSSSYSYVLRSLDGIEWEEATVKVANTAIQSRVAYDPIHDKYFAVDNTDNKKYVYWVSADELMTKNLWNYSSSAKNCNNIAADKSGRVLAFMTDTANGGYYIPLYTLDGGTTWTQGTKLSFSASYLYWVEGRFYAIYNQANSYMYYSADGLAWTKCTGAMSAHVQRAEAVLDYDGDKFRFSGGNNLYESSDGVNWSKVYTFASSAFVTHIE